MGIKLTAEIFSGFMILHLAVISVACQGARSNENTGKMPIIENVEKRQEFNINPAEMPAPFETTSALRSSKVIMQPADATLRVPKGFKVNIFAEGNFKNPRWMALAPNGDVFLADARANSIYILRDSNGDGIAEERFTFAENLSQPFGMAFHDGWLYLANTDSVVRFAYTAGQTLAGGPPEKLITLTAGGYNQHWTRNIIFSPDGKKLYVSIGSSGNVDIEPDERRAAINEYDPEGGNHRVYASGLRNPIGLDWNPVTKELWTAVNERDGLGDNLVPDYVTGVKDGGFYGYPYLYLGKNIDPRRNGDQIAGMAERTTIPDVLLTSHSAALGLAFYRGGMFPKEYQNDAFVALHGSWNRQNLTGYKVIRVKFKDGRPIGGYEDFLSGWLSNEASNEVWGRPVGLLVISDGSLLISDDGANKIWRVSF